MGKRKGSLPTDSSVKRPRPSNPSKWSVEHVATYFESDDQSSAVKEFAATVRARKISGQAIQNPEYTRGVHATVHEKIEEMFNPLMTKVHSTISMAQVSSNWRSCKTEFSQQSVCQTQRQLSVC